VAARPPPAPAPPASSPPAAPGRASPWAQRAKLLCLALNFALVARAWVQHFTRADALVFVGATAALLAVYLAAKLALAPSASGPPLGRRRAFVLTCAISVYMVVSGAPFAAAATRAALAGDAAAFLRATAGGDAVARAALVAFAAELLLDLAVGLADYAGELGLVAGFLHHTAFLAALAPTLGAGTAPAFLALAAVCEVPTLMLSAGTIAPRLRCSDAAFGAAFLATRVAYCVFFLAAVLRLSPRPAPRDALLGALAPALALHCFWFVSWARGAARRSRGAARPA